jgi:hypothetical protein
MDPYLEDPAGWPSVHHGLISQIMAVLNRDLRPNYFARAEERVYISDQDDPGRRVIVPDVRLVERGTEGGSNSPGANGADDVAVAEPVVATTLIEDEIREPRVEIIDAEGRGVVTVIEVVSPANKVPGSRGQASFRRKRSEVMTSTTHWVEADLLREGATLVAAEALPQGDYFVHVSRVRQRPSGLIWPIRLPQRLPVIDVPLRNDGPTYRLDLQQVLDAVYDGSNYDLSIDYTQPPCPPLREEYAAWADQLLREKKLT